MLLTIGIPTFNRIDSLKKTVLEVHRQLSLIDENKFQIEVLIFDNASSDGTYEFFKNYNFPSNFIYHRQSKNVGFDRNVNSLFEYASGQYLWTLSDDDNIKTDAIKNIYEELSKYNYVRFAFVNYIINQNKIIYPSSCSINEGVLVIDSVNLLNCVKFSNTFISSCIFNRVWWNKTYPEKYFDTSWIHLYMARDILLGGKSLVIGDVLVEMLQLDLKSSRCEKNKVEGIEFYFHAHLKIVEFCNNLSLYGYPIDQETDAIQFCIKGDLSHIINYKLTSVSFDFKEIIEIIKRMYVFRYKFIRFYLIFIPLILSPNFVFKFAYETKKYLQFYSK